ncbi:selenoneine biosynthesis selenosugar synthase SenB [Methylobacterium sp. PvR107]|uniref:selenoneine biosynthesis selenosugar synthase SenB n=1 Tax=Methylobacterium sp. PvR107 TaxID=2806597 RepID=UPI001AEA1AED|nr:selenoneine biosynthesis selenosugar synthase SenB [Methylobacterium sp. PvR107]MBP1179418.1 putative glycosyltransferase (TIGR04348 family) [Methylobacterium sp. PvR107]
MKISLITPAARTSRAGNRTTAIRWARILGDLGHQVDVATDYAEDADADLMLALHAWRSAAAIARFKALHPDRPLVVALAGTDIYHFLSADPEPMLRSLDLADRLIGLHDLVAAALPQRHRAKVDVVFQSALPRRLRWPVSEEAFEILVVGHLRAEKDPFRAARAARRLPARSRIRIVHLGGAHEAVWAARARAEMADNPRYLWLGDRPGSLVRRWLTRGRVMVLSSHQEGGANVVSEAIVSGLPVIASDIPGTRGLLGSSYPGYFPVGDDAALAALLLRAEEEPAFLSTLAAYGAARAELFAPAQECESLRRVVARCTEDRSDPTAPPSAARLTKNPDRRRSGEGDAS